MSLIYIICGLVLIIIIIIYILILSPIEGFQGQSDYRVQPVGHGWDANFPSSSPAGLSWDFQSPKSNIKNFNETTEITQPLNTLQPNTSLLIGHNQQIPLWIYPYHYLNRAFDKILLHLANQMEKDYNDNHLLEETDNHEWQMKYDYMIANYEELPQAIQGVISDIIYELNRRFNLDPPIVNFKHEKIQYYWKTPQDLIVIISVYKTYTPSDIRYQEDKMNPSLNDHLKDNFERKLLIYVDQFHNDDEGLRYHLKYLRFPSVDYDKTNPMDNMRYKDEYDDLFYLAKSKDPLYRMLTNTEARDIYLERVEAQKALAKSKCFSRNPGGIKTFIQPRDRTSCDLNNGLWEKKCEKDTDCPYFQANKNYPNDLGGCNQKTGYCQFPIGAEALTYRKVRNENQSECYNCDQGNLGPQTLGQCCSDQKQKNKYSKLKSPDYAFEKDLEQRFKSRQVFDKLGLNWSKYPT